MGTLYSILAAAKKRFTKPAVVVKKSEPARHLAKVLNGRLSLDDEIKAAVGKARAEIVQDETPCPPIFGDFKTIGEHAAASSSSNDKLAMLTALVRWAEAKTILEIGTAYGISGIALGSCAKLTTVEGFEPQATIGPRNIASAGVEAECIKGRKEDVIPRLAAEGRAFGLIFHDGGHTGDAYVRDFEAIRPMTGSVFVIDDIFHDDNPNQRARTKSESTRSCREGWNEIVARPEIKGAVLFRKVGILLIGSGGRDNANTVRPSSGNP